MKNKTIKEILVLVKEELIANRLQKTQYQGMCSVIMGLKEYNKINKTEYLLWEAYWKAFTLTRVTFYTDYFKTGITRTKDKDWYAWPPRQTPLRIKWLNKHIKLN